MKLNCNFISRALGRAVEISVVLPSPVFCDVLGVSGEEASYAPKEKYPVLYLLHGVGNDKNSWLGYSRAELYAEENNIALVTFGGENKFYIDHGGEKWEEFVEMELPELVCGYFPVSDRPQDTFIAGLSMGGYGAMLHFLRQPRRYGAAGCFSGAVEKAEFPKEEAARYEIAKLLEKAAEKGGLPPVYVTCGEDDFIYDNSLRLAEKLRALGLPHTWESTPHFSHEWRFWDLALERFMRWLPRTDAYAERKRKV